MSFGRGPGRRHGDPLPRSAPSIERLAEVEAQRARSKAQRRAKPDLADLSGEVGYLPEDLMPNDHEALPTEFHDALEEIVDAQLREQNALARQMGVGTAPWNVGDLEFEREYHSDGLGIDASTLAAEKERLLNSFNMDRENLRITSRADVERAAAQAAYTDSLAQGFRAAYGTDYSDADVAAAGRAVAQQYRAEGFDPLQRIQHDPEAFYDQVYMQLGNAPRSSSDAGGRTQGFNEWGGRASGGADDDTQPGSLSDELNADKKRTNYY